MQRLPPNSASLGAAQPSQGLSKIAITQIFFLLSTLNQEKDKAKRETLHDQINGVRSPFFNTRCDRADLILDDIPIRNGCVPKVLPPRRISQCRPYF